MFVWPTPTSSVIERIEANGGSIAGRAETDSTPPLLAKAAGIQPVNFLACHRPVDRVAGDWLSLGVRDRAIE